MSKELIEGRIPAKPIAFAREMSKPFSRWVYGAMTAVLIATICSRLFTFVLGRLTDNAISFGQGNADASDIWRWVLIFPALYLGNEGGRVASVGCAG